jgi:hypothetical protein
MMKHCSVIATRNPMLTLLVAVFLFFSCEKELISPIPSAPVNIQLDLDFQDIDLVAPLATKSITQPRIGSDRLGFGGILVINGYSDNGAIKLYAYDLACPVEVDRNIKIKVIPDNTGKAKCTKCGAVYNLAYGTGNPESVSKYSLRSYAVRNVGGNKYLVF